MNHEELQAEQRRYARMFKTSELAMAIMWSLYGELR